MQPAAVSNWARICRVSGRVATPALRPAEGSVIEVARIGGAMAIERPVSPDGHVSFFAIPGPHTIRLVGPDGRASSAWAIEVPSKPTACLAGLVAASIKENCDGN